MVDSFRAEKLAGEAASDGRTVTARLSGTASHRDIEALDRFLAQVLDEARRSAAAVIVIDVRDLVYMNSSHLKSVVSWLGAIGRCDPRPDVRLRANPAHHWQKRSVEAIGALAPGLVTVES